MDKNLLQKELGIMLFQCSKKGVVDKDGDYDIVENLKFIMLALDKEICYEDLKEGFIQESENYGLGTKEIKRLFQETIEEMKD